MVALNIMPAQSIICDNVFYHNTIIKCKIISGIFVFRIVLILFGYFLKEFWRHLKTKIHFHDSIEK